MRLLYLVSHYPRWSETFVRQDVLLLKEAGADLRLLSLFPGECPMESGWPKAEIVQEAFPASRQASASPKRRLRDMLCPAWLRERISLFRHRKLLEKVKEYCLRERIDCIYGEFADLAGLLACQAAKELSSSFPQRQNPSIHATDGSRIPFLLGLHARDVHAFKYTERLFREAAAILICNRDARDAFLAKHPFAASRTVLLPHGIDLRQWEYQPPKCPAHPHRLLFAGRLVPKKGVGLLLEAMRQLPECELEVLGTGPLESALHQQAQGLSVRWAGRCSRDEVRDRMRQASFLIVPSMVAADGDRDGVPNVVLEAMASGLPVIGSQAGSLPEVLTEKTGWPFAEATPECLAKTIRAAIAAPEECRRHSAAARSLIEAEYDAQRLAQQRLDILTNTHA